MRTILSFKKKEFFLSPFNFNRWQNSHSKELEPFGEILVFSSQIYNLCMRFDEHLVTFFRLRFNMIHSYPNLIIIFLKKINQINVEIKQITKSKTNGIWLVKIKRPYNKMI